MIISIHIPKTAGASFKAGLRYRFGKRLLLDYADRPLSGSAYHRCLRFWTRVKVPYEVAQLIANYDVIHGHFIASKYLPLKDHADFYAFFRDPVERLMSQYRYWLANPDPRNAMWVKFNAENMTPRQFAALPRQQRFYELFTAALPMERFAFVGLTEEYESSLRLFKAIFGIDIPYQRINVGVQSVNDLEAHEREMITVQFLQKNYAIYDAARWRFDTLCREYLKR